MGKEVDILGTTARRLLFLSIHVCECPCVVHIHLKFFHTFTTLLLKKSFLTLASWHFSWPLPSMSSASGVSWALQDLVHINTSSWPLGRFPSSLHNSLPVILALSLLCSFGLSPGVLLFFKWGDQAAESIPTRVEHMSYTPAGTHRLPGTCMQFQHRPKFILFLARAPPHFLQ